MKAMSGHIFTLAVVFDTCGDARPMDRARSAAGSLPDDDHERRNDAQLLTFWRYDPKAFLRAFGGGVDDRLLARLARAGAISSELLALVDGAQQLAA